MAKKPIVAYACYCFALATFSLLKATIVLVSASEDAMRGETKKLESYWCSVILAAHTSRETDNARGAESIAS